MCTYIYIYIPYYACIFLYKMFITILGIYIYDICNMYKYRYVDNVQYLKCVNIVIFIMHSSCNIYIYIYTYVCVLCIIYIYI